MDKKILTVGVIGFGLSGRYLMIPYLMVNKNFKVKTVVQHTSDTASKIFPGVKTTKNPDDILTDPEIDVIIISSPNNTHFDYAKRSLLAGKHVLVEKPMTTTFEEAQELMALAQKVGKILSVYQNRRFDGCFKTVQKIINSRILGDIFNVELRFDRWRPEQNPKKWKEIPALGTGILYDLGAHVIDQALYLFGVPTDFDGIVQQQRPGSEIDDAFDIRLYYPKQIVTLKSSMLVREPTPRFVLHGTHGSFVKYGVDPQEDQLKAGMTPDMPNFGEDAPAFYGSLNTDINGLNFQGKIKTLKGDFGELFQNFYEAIVEGKELNVKPALVAEQIRIMETIKKGGKNISS